MADFKLVNWTIRQEWDKYSPGDTVTITVDYTVERLKNQLLTWGSWSVNAIILINGIEQDRDGHAQFSGTKIGAGSLTPRFVMPGNNVKITIEIEADGTTLASYDMTIKVDKAITPGTPVAPSPKKPASPKPGSPAAEEEEDDKEPGEDSEMMANLKKYAPYLVVAAGLIIVLLPGKK